MIVRDPAWLTSILKGGDPVYLNMTGLHLPYSVWVYVENINGKQVVRYLVAANQSTQSKFFDKLPQTRAPLMLNGALTESGRVISEMSGELKPTPDGGLTFEPTPEARPQFQCDSCQAITHEAVARQACKRKLSNRFCSGHYLPV